MTSNIALLHASGCATKIARQRARHQTCNTTRYRAHNNVHRLTSCIVKGRVSSMTNHIVHMSGTGTSHEEVSTTTQTSGYDIERQLVQDLVFDLASRITSQTAHDSASTSQEWTYLRQLAALVAIRAAAEELANTAVSEAARCGASYPAIGEAAGMTRQAARVRWPGLVRRTRAVRKSSQQVTEAGSPTADREDS
ncbi:hypothetical protein AB0I90_31775 [Micromonospora wenchangensis]|uniref:hypothetical protein n=1 Tax=Micromonospora wenchangensis TaxID=1185415 RepID=UPI0033EEF586